MIIPDEIRLFIKDITLFLQRQSNYTPDKIEPMFQRAYKFYSKYEVETEQANSADSNNKANQPDSEKPCEFCGCVGYHKALCMHIPCA